MKRLILTACLALSATPSLAATYSYTSTAAQEAIITDARGRANASLPATVDNGSGQQVANPAIVTDNVTFIGNLLLNAINSWNSTRVQAPVTVPEKNLVIQLLNADIARGDGNSVTAQVLKDRILANQ